MQLDLSHGGVVRLVAGAVGVLMALYHMWAIALGAPEALLFRGMHLLFAMVLVFLLLPRGGAAMGQLPSLADYLLLVLSAVPILYLFLNYDYVVTRIFYVDDLKPADMVLGVLLTLLVIEATRRVIGWALPLTA